MKQELQLMQIQEKAHAKFSASSTKRWKNCTASIGAIENAPPQSESEFAIEGTTAHEVMEIILCAIRDGGINAYTKKMRIELVKKYGVQMVAHVEEMVDYVISRLKQNPDATLIVERKAPLSIHPDSGGTLDCGLVDEFATLEVMDFKYGAGVVVEPEENEQILTYGLSLAEEYDFNFSEIRLTIIQPRAFHPSGESIRTWVTTAERLKEFRKEISKAISDIENGETKFEAGEWCRFCPAAVTCPALYKEKLESAAIAFDDVMDEPVLPHPNDLEPEQVAKILKASETLTAWISQVEKYALDLLSRGGKIDGFKLVAKQGRRQWSAPLDAEKRLKRMIGDLAFETSLKSPAQIEKLKTHPDLKDWVKENCVSVSSGVTIAPESDKRPAVNALENAFGGDNELNDLGLGLEIETKSNDKTEGKKENGKKESKEKSGKESGTKSKSEKVTKEKSKARKK